MFLIIYNYRLAHVSHEARALLHHATAAVLAVKITARGSQSENRDVLHRTVE